MHRWFRSARAALSVPLLLALSFVIACGAAATATPEPTATSPGPTPSTGGAGEQATPTQAPAAEPTATSPPAQAGIVEETINVGVQDIGPIQGVGDPFELGAPRIGRANVSIFETLVISAPNGDLVPHLFRDWTLSDDGLTWTFFLHEGVPFHQGFGELTAEDVVWTWMRSTEEGSKFGRAAPLATIVREGAEVEIIDPHTITLTHERPKWDTLLSWRAPYGGGLAMQSQEAFDAGMVDTPVGTGPWQFVQARTAEFWELEAVEDHWRQTPFFRNLRFWEIPEEATRLASLETGKLDTGEIAFQSLERLREVPGFKFNSSEDTGQMQIHLWGQFYSTDRPGYNPEFPWVSSNLDINSEEWKKARNVRLAMAIAIDRELIVDQLLGGEGRPQHYWGDSGNSVLDPLKAENPEPFAYDPDRAVQLLEEAGYPDGFEVPMACYPRGLPAEIQVCEAIATMWEAIGLQTTVTKPPYSALRPRMFDRELDVVHPHGLGTYPEPLALWPNATYVKGGWNAGFEHPIVDELIAEGNAEAVSERRWEITREISRFMTEHVTHIPVYVPNIIYPVGPKIDVWPLQGGDKKLIHNFEFIPPRQ